MPINNKPVYDAPTPPSSTADLIKKLIDQYSSASSLSFWFLGSACVIAVFLFIQNYSKTDVYFPFFIQKNNGSVIMTLTASKSAALLPYAFFGNNKISFNDLLK